uniref:Uncharacterized protein n=1 Tax=Trichogramma kaykai TaxID=54128 RepID=A0ABD2XPP2_9HYME
MRRLVCLGLLLHLIGHNPTAAAAPHRLHRSGTGVVGSSSSTSHHHHHHHHHHNHNHHQNNDNNNKNDGDRAKCEPLRVPACRGLRYNLTAMPNFMGHADQLQAERAKVANVLTTKTSFHLKDILCVSVLRRRCISLRSLMRRPRNKEKEKQVKSKREKKNVEILGTTPGTSRARTANLAFQKRPILSCKGLFCNFFTFFRAQRCQFYVENVDED